MKNIFPVNLQNIWKFDYKDSLYYIDNTRAAGLCISGDGILIGHIQLDPLLLTWINFNLIKITYPFHYSLGIV